MLAWLPGCFRSGWTDIPNFCQTPTISNNIPTIDDSKFQLLALKLIIVQLNNIKQDLSCCTFWINWKNLFKAIHQHQMIRSFHPSGMTLTIWVLGMFTTRTHPNDSKSQISNLQLAAQSAKIMHTAHSMSNTCICMYLYRNNSHESCEVPAAFSWMYIELSWS